MYSSTDRLLLSIHHSIYMYDTARLKKQPGKKRAEIDTHSTYTTFVCM